METETVNLPTVRSFKYLGSTINRRGGASKDVENRVANYDTQKRRSQQRRGEQSGKL